jgi:hypothetical protein
MLLLEGYNYVFQILRAVGIVQFLPFCDDVII